MADEAPPYEHTPTSDPRTADAEQKVVTPTESRQGIETGRVRYVLAIGTILVIVAFALVYFFG
jgi:hypothetical protein